MSKAHCYAQSLPLLLVLACAREKPPALTDPVEASSRVTALAAKGCSGLADALALLTGFHGRPLVELVDDALAAAPDAAACKLAPATAAHELARARVLDLQPAAALAMLTRDREPAIRIRRAELLDQLGRPADALRELATLTDLDDTSRTLQRLLAVSTAARAAPHTVAQLVADAPVTERTQLAFRAAADASPAALASMIEGAPAELASAIGDRIEREAGPAAALAARTRAALAAPDLAEHHDALARAQIAAGETAAALASWDRAADLAPAQPAYRITPIRALVIANQPALAKQRATALAAVARAATDARGGQAADAHAGTASRGGAAAGSLPVDVVELRLTASQAAAFAGDHALAVALGREALAMRPTDGRLAFELAHRLVEAGDRAAAARAYAELLVCGAHGRPWHRHEVAAKLAALGDVARPALDAKRACAVVEPDDLAQYTRALR